MKEIEDQAHVRMLARGEQVDRYKDIPGSLEHHVLTRGKVLYG